MSVLPRTNPTAFIKDFVSPFAETELITFGRKRWEISSRLGTRSENLIFVVAPDAAAEAASGRLGLVQELPAGKVYLKKLRTALPSVAAFGWVCLSFCLPGWRGGRGGRGQGDEQGRASSPWTCAGFPVLPSQVPVSWQASDFGCKITALGYRVRKRFLPHPPPSSSLSFVFPWAESGDYRDKILGLAGINRHIQRDSFHSLWLYQLEEMCLGLSAPCMQIHFASFYFWMDTCAVWSAVFLPVQICGCYPVEYSLYQPLPLRFCLGKSRAAKNNSRAGICRPAPILLDVVGAMWKKRVLAG